MSAGQPTKYKKDFARQAHKACAMGATDFNLAELFNVTQRTIDNWKQEHPEFFQSIKDGKAEMDNQVERSLLQRALGYEHPDTHFSTNEGVVTATPTVKRYPPDPTAMIFWLKNRKPKVWRDKNETEHSGTICVEELAAAIARQRKRGEAIHPPT